MQQTKFKCSAGNVTIHSATMQQTPMRGKYTVRIDAEYRGKREVIEKYTIDSQLFDLLGDMESDADRAAHILRTYLAEIMIEDWVAEIPDVEKETVSDETAKYFANELQDIDRFIASTGINSEKRDQVVGIMKIANNKIDETLLNLNQSFAEMSDATDAIIEETSKKLAAL
jgi:hypothetical protein